LLFFLLFFQLFAFVVLVEYNAGGNELKATENDHHEDSDCGSLWSLTKGDLVACCVRWRWPKFAGCADGQV
jgi:hypothetical protein